MTHSARRIRVGVAALLLAGIIPADGAGQSRSVPLSPEAWIATDSIRFASYLGRPALYINRGVALVRGGAMENGTLELDVAATDTTNFLGVAFRARKPSSMDPHSTAWGAPGRMFVPPINGWRDEPMDMNVDHSYCPTYVAINWKLANSWTRVNPATVVEIPFTNGPTKWEYKLYVRIEKVAPTATVAAPGARRRSAGPGVSTYCRGAGCELAHGRPGARIASSAAKAA